jgi:hypothetical protein
MLFKVSLWFNTNDITTHNYLFLASHGMDAGKNFQISSMMRKFWIRTRGIRGDYAGNLISGCRLRRRFGVGEKRFIDELIFFHGRFSGQFGQQRQLNPSEMRSEWNSCNHLLSLIQPSVESDPTIRWVWSNHPLSLIQSSVESDPTIRWVWSNHPLSLIQSSVESDPIIRWVWSNHPLSLIQSSVESDPIIRWVWSNHPLAAGYARKSERSVRRKKNHYRIKAPEVFRSDST